MLNISSVCTCLYFWPGAKINRPKKASSRNMCLTLMYGGPVGWWVGACNDASQILSIEKFPFGQLNERTCGEKAGKAKGWRANLDRRRAQAAYCCQKCGPVFGPKIVKLFGDERQILVLYRTWLVAIRREIIMWWSNVYVECWQWEINLQIIDGLNIDGIGPTS